MPGKRIRKLPKELQVPSNTSTQEIYASLAQATGYSIHRLRITKGVDKTVVPNSKDKTLEDVGLENNSLVHVKDLGMCRASLSDKKHHPLFLQNYI